MMMNPAELLDAIAKGIRAALPPWPFRTRENPLGGLPTWMINVLELREPNVPNAMVVPSIIPIIDVMAVATRPVAGAQTLAVPGVPEQLPNIPGALVLVQSIPANVDNVLLGFGNGNLPIVLTPGASVEASVQNANVFFFDSAGAGAVTVAFSVLQVV